MITAALLTVSIPLVVGLGVWYLTTLSYGLVMALSHRNWPRVSPRVKAFLKSALLVNWCDRRIEAMLDRQFRDKP